jgi:hypothetical protein
VEGGGGGKPFYFIFTWEGDSGGNLRKKRGCSDGLLTMSPASLLFYDITMIYMRTQPPSSRTKTVVRLYCLYPFAFRSRVDPRKTEPGLTLTVLTVNFCLALPQFTLSSATHKSLLHSFNSASTSAKSTTAPLITLATTLTALSPAAQFALLGTAASTDMIAKFDHGSCYSKFLPAQLTHLIRRIPAHPIHQKGGSKWHCKLLAITRSKLRPTAKNHH